MKKLLIVSAVALTLLTSGCSAGTPAPTATPTSSPIVTMTPAEAKASFLKIAEASCTKAQAVGIVEQIGADVTVVMVPKPDAYKDYSAAYLTAPDDYQLIWESDGFVPCSIWSQQQMAAEGGGEVEFTADFLTSTGEYRIKQTFDGEEYSDLYKVVDGIIVSCLAENTKVETTVKYGNITAEEKQILIESVTRFEAEG